MPSYLLVPSPTLPGMAHRVELPLEVEHAGEAAVEAFYASPPPAALARAELVPYPAPALETPADTEEG